MTIVNYCTVMIGILGIIYGFFQIIAKRSPWKEDEKYTEESARRFATIEGLILVACGLCLGGMGLSSNGAVLDADIYDKLLGTLIGLAVLDLIAAKKIQKLK